MEILEVLQVILTNFIILILKPKFIHLNFSILSCTFAILFFLDFTLGKLGNPNFTNYKIRSESLYKTRLKLQLLC